MSLFHILIFRWQQHLLFNILFTYQTKITMLKTIKNRSISKEQTILLIYSIALINTEQDNAVSGISPRQPPSGKSVLFQTFSLWIYTQENLLNVVRNMIYIILQLNIFTALISNQNCMKETTTGVKIKLKAYFFELLRLTKIPFSSTNEPQSTA